jgi:hypothetical protein
MKTPHCSHPEVLDKPNPPKILLSCIFWVAELFLREEASAQAKVFPARVYTVGPSAQ